MEGEPKQPEHTTPEEVQDFEMYLGVVPLTDEEKELVLSLIKEPRLGLLEFYANGVKADEVLVRSTKTNKELVTEFTDAFEDIIDAPLKIEEDDLLPTDLLPVKIRVEFVPLTPEQLQQRLH
ncbi:MAG: hypothetical protein ACAH17_01680 [Candidatus Paceibacterota bacterium]